MSKKQWMVLLMLFLTYLLLGASIFYHIESRMEIERAEKAKYERIEINALLHAHYVPTYSHDHDEILGKLTRYCGKSVYNYTDGETDPLKWDFYNSFYFAYTVVSTIGYGNLAPTNMLGRILMIFYGLIGIPMNGILLSQLGEFFGHVFVKAHRKYKSYKRSRNDYQPKKVTTFETRKLGLAAQIFIYLTPGFIMFIFFPAFLFSHYEGWSYDEAVYYAFVTLTTIGFGDYVAVHACKDPTMSPRQDNTKGSGFFFILYKTFLICWISFGLGYIVMIMTFIARGMRSKKITRIEHKLAINLKHTQSKIWNEFNKEIDYFRRVFNELQLSKVKRVYVNEYNYEIPPAKFPRSNSFPNLRDLLYGTKQSDTVTLCYRPRRRANSEVVATEDEIARVVSETDLQRIDKTATFASHAMIQPAELLAKLVNILGYIPPATEDAEGDCSHQTTMVEQETQRGKVESSNGREECSPRRESMYAQVSGPASWTIGTERISRDPRLRSRAASEIRLHETKNEDRKVEWTWSGPSASRRIQELIKVRSNESKERKDQGSRGAKFSDKLRGFALARAVPKALISTGPWRTRFSTCSEKKGPELERELDRKDRGQSFVAGPAACSDDRRDDSHSRRHYYTHTGAGNDDLGAESSTLLEETSVADFLRALTFLHASVTGNGGWTAAADELQRTRPQRKMGTASLTPPKLPSLFTLFSPLSSESNENTIMQESNRDHQRDTRRGSLGFVTPAIKKPRRFSLRPVATPISPPTPPKSNSPLLSDSRRLVSPHESKSTFLFESPKEPLIRTEGAPGLSSPIKLPSNGRRFSLRAAQNHGDISPGGNSGGSSSNNGVVPSLKSVPRWKAGMLQRQIGQMNLRRRVRAFSLSDVQADDLNKKVEPVQSDLSSSSYKKNNRDLVRKNVCLQGVGQQAVRSAEHSDQFTGSNDAIESPNEPTVPPVPSYPQSDGKEKGYEHIPVESALLQSIRQNENENENEAEKQRLSDSLTVHIESQQPLVQVKTENPLVSPIQTRFSKVPTDAQRDNSVDLTDIKIEKYQKNS